MAMTASRPVLRRLSAVVLLVVALLLMASLATFGFLKARTVEAQIEAKRGQLQSLRQRASILALDVDDKRGPQQADAAQSLLLPASSRGSAAARLQSELIQMVKQAGGRAGVVRVLPSQDHDALAKVTVNLALDADIVGLREFLFRLETKTPLIYVEQMEISTARPRRQATRSQPDSASPKLNINLQVSSFVLREGGS
ncbi:MAG: hypothetical protein ACI9XZ_002540 [Alphaproteobacteria bacterium]|jgi:hypothetical protein